MTHSDSLHCTASLYINYCLIIIKRSCILGSCLIVLAWYLIGLVISEDWLLRLAAILHNENSGENKSCFHSSHNTLLYIKIHLAVSVCQM